MKRPVLASTAVLALATAGGIGYFIAPHSSPAVTRNATAQPSGNEIVYWYDPMKPEQHFEHPGTSPMGMQLVPKYAGDSAAGDANAVRVSPAAVQNLGMRTATVKVGRLTDAVNVPGTVTWDPQLAVTVSARTNITLARLYVRAPFTHVKAGQPLAEILAPQWSAATAEYFALADSKSAEGRALRAAARARLHALGMDDATIRGLHAGGNTITLRAPIYGIVSTLDVKEGQQVGEGMPIMTLNGLDKVWVEAAIPQAQGAGVAMGTPITATFSALPDKTFQGEVAQLLPEVDAATRTQRARIVLDNPGYALAPGMFAELRIAGTAGLPRPLVPTEAIIADGVHTRVIEALGDGRFRPVQVKTGRSADGMTAILAGLHGGERIVTSGQFLIDSEASLSGALERMGAGLENAGSDRVEPLSRRERGRGEGSHELRRTRPYGPSSGPLGHLLPEGEGAKPATSGMGAPTPASTSHGHGAHP